MESGNRASIANAWPLDAEFFGLALDGFASGALGGHSVGERASAIHQDARPTTRLVVEIFLTTFAFQERFLFAGLAGGLREGEGTARALRLIAVRVSETEGRGHRRLIGHNATPSGSTTVVVCP